MEPHVNIITKKLMLAEDLDLVYDFLFPCLMDLYCILTICFSQIHCKHLALIIYTKLLSISMEK